MPLYDFQCDSCSVVTERLEPISTESISCPACGQTARRIISFRGEPVWNEDAPWIRSVLDVVDKDSKASHVQEFIRHPTRQNYRAWMKGEGLRHLEPGEGKRDREKEERQQMKRITKQVLEQRRRDRRIEI